MAGLVLGCAGGIPKIPDTPQAILAKADAYYSRGKYLQAVTLYDGFLERFGGHERADYAQFRLAESNFHNADYAAAAVEYEVVVANYGYSEYVDDALFQMGVCFWRQSPKAPRDQQKATDALSRFNQFIHTFPNSPLGGQARDYVVMIHTKLAEKALSTARWYHRQDETEAALIYCDKIIQDYPDNPNWAAALYLKGLILLERGKKDEAIQQFTRVLEYPGDTPLKREAEFKIRKARQL